jgi:hypothetical protein
VFIYEYPESLGNLNIKLQECAVIAIRIGATTLLRLCVSYFSEGQLTSVPMKLVFFCAHLPSVVRLLQQSRLAAGNGLGTGLGTTISDVRISS